MRNKDYRQWIGLSAVMAGMIVAIRNYLAGDVVFASALFALLLGLLGALLWWTRPSRGGFHISHAAAQSAAGPGGVIVYWRPGCIHSDRLKVGLGQARRDVSWVNVARDVAAADFVATFHDGNVTVPTAVTGAGQVIDATPTAIRAHLSETPASPT